MLPTPMLQTLLLSLGCSPAPPAPAPTASRPELAEPDVSKALAPKALVAEEPGWGAVMSVDGTWYRTGGGELAATPKGAVPLQPSGSIGPCGDVIAEATGAMIVLKAGATAPAITPAPPIQAALVERAAWRLDELLPAMDPFSPAPTSQDPSRARGVEVGSVAKARQVGGPPILVTAGHRGCAGVIAVLDAEATRVLSYDVLDQACEPLRVLPLNDLDGDGRREVAAWSRSRTALYRLDESQGKANLVRLADWTCK